MTRVLISGATGTIGGHLCQALLARGDEPVALSRDPLEARSKLPQGVEIVGWPDPIAAPPPEGALAGATAVVNLLGEPIAQRWSAEAKRRMRDSRIGATRMLVKGLQAVEADRRPGVLVSQSATGYYGPRDATELTEDAPAGHDFLAELVRDWEAAALDASSDLRVAVTRTGVVLSPGGGALEKMLPFFRAGVGGPVAGGRQYVPWIHVDDVTNALLFCIDEPGVAGPVNLTAPRPVDNAELSRALGHALHRPAVLPVPGFALQILYGEMAEIITTGQRVLPARLLELGFDFRHPEVEEALRDVLGTERPA